MIDFHTHILPGIDDGSRDIQMTEQMLEKEAASGVTLVYATPHFYAHRTGVSSFLAKRDASYRKVRELLETREDLLRSARRSTTSAAWEGQSTRPVCVWRVPIYFFSKCPSSSGQKRCIEIRKN